MPSPLPQGCLYKANPWKQQSIFNKFESSNTQFHKSLYAEMETLERSNMWVYKTGPSSYMPRVGTVRLCKIVGGVLRVIHLLSVQDPIFFFSFFFLFLQISITPLLFELEGWARFVFFFLGKVWNLLWKKGRNKEGKLKLFEFFFFSSGCLKCQMVAK